MRIDWPATKKIVLGHFALLLLLWWGGLNCLSGCLAAPADTAAEEYCPMAGEGGDCGHRRARAKDLFTSESIGESSTPEQSQVCCSLETLTADVKRDAHAAAPATATVVPRRIEFTPESFPRAQLPDRWVRLPDRGGIRLLHCIFLI
jgi:hypothetical protein